MNTSSKCPSTVDLRDLLEGNVPDSNQVAMVSHLDQCASCQESLEAMAKGESSIAVTLLEQAAHKAPPDSAYWPALENAEQALTVAEPPGRRLSTEISLAFLDPPEDGSHLGSLNNFNIVRVVGRG